jgi:hypothetical protein
MVTIVGRSGAVDASASSAPPAALVLGRAAAVRPIQPSTTRPMMTAAMRTAIGPHAEARTRATSDDQRDVDGEGLSAFVFQDVMAAAPSECRANIGSQ